MPRVRRGLVMDPMFESYVDAALSSLASPHQKESIRSDVMERMLQDCTAFRDMAGEGYEVVCRNVHPADIGCDLWVTRNNWRKVSDEAPGFWAPEYRSLRVSSAYVDIARRLGPWRLVEQAPEGLVVDQPGVFDEGEVKWGEVRSGEPAPQPAPEPQAAPRAGRGGLQDIFDGMYPPEGGLSEAQRIQPVMPLDVEAVERLSTAFAEAQAQSCGLGTLWIGTLQMTPVLREQAPSTTPEQVPQIACPECGGVGRTSPTRRCRACNGTGREGGVR